MKGIEDTLPKGHRICGSVFEDYESYSEQACSEKNWSLQEVIELLLMRAISFQIKRDVVVMDTNIVLSVTTPRRRYLLSI